MLSDAQTHPPGDEFLPTAQAEVYPASLAQRRLWFLDQLQGPTAAYNVHVGLWLYGPLNLTALQLAFQQVVNRHDVFRTSFRLEKGELLQAVAKSCTIELPITDLAGVSEPYPRAYEVAKQEVEAPFDLSRGPLFRARIIRIGVEEHVLLCTMHHTVTDAWSMQVFAKELAVAYEAFSNHKPPALPEIAIQYGDYSEWQLKSLESEAVQKQLAYWKENLKDAPPLLDLSTPEQPRPSEQTLQGATHTFPVPGEVIPGISSVAAQNQATPFMILLAAFKVLLYRYSGETDVLVGVPVAGRSQIETENLIGFFVDTLVLRDDLGGNPQFVDLLAQVRETTLGALASADVPFEKVVEALQPERNLSYNPVFQVMFSVIKSAIRSHSFGDIDAYPYVVYTSTSIFDLSATFIEDSDAKWWLQFEYSTGLFHHDRIAQIFEDYIALLRAIASNPEVRIDELPVPSVKSGIARRPAGMRNRGKIKEETSTRSARPRRRLPSEPTVAEEALLAEIWKDLLGVEKVGIRDNFFDIGGHSLLAARLIAQIQDATGRKIPVSAIFRAPTIESLARLLKDDTVSKPDPVLMQLHRGSGGVPFFTIAAPGVDSLGLALLARHLGEKQPVYKLQSPGPPIWERPFEKQELRALAQEYVAAIRTVQPRGPFCLGGMCDGVLIAQQMILELEAQGEEVALFAIFDTWVLENSQIRPLWAVDYYLQRVRALPNLSLKEQLAAVLNVLRRWMGRNGSGGNAWGKTYWPGEDFQPPRFQAPVLLFKRPRQPYFYVRDPQMGWGARSLGGVEIREIDCGHFELLRTPHVQIIGRQLAQRLQEINERLAHSGFPYNLIQDQARNDSGWTPTA
jgi:thioesterase domain-containing protein/acyl carrier protein